MADLESILIKFKGKGFSVFANDGSLTKEGLSVYSEFCSLLYDLESIVPKFRAEEIEKELDFIAEIGN
ncbi:MAG: hypothetical protein GX638_16695 [Crenarchaeota archaeon]|nr:hypothetical protein [Thermoproteota archaeon]